MEPIDHRIEATELRLKKLRAQRQQLEARKRAEESKRKRSDDTRRKILVGAAILAKVERGEWPQARLLEMMSKTLTRPDDRALFGLPNTATGKEPVVPAGEQVQTAPAEGT
jgi:hypothetical protein